MKCQNCGTKNPPQAIYCLSCGGKLEEIQSQPGKQHITLGDYEVADYDNEPASYKLSEIDPAEPIIDRDSAFLTAPVHLNAPKKLFVNLMLIGLLFLIGGLSAFGVNAVGKMRQNKESDLIRQVEIQKEAAVKARKEAYLKTYREFIILAQAQAEDFQTNLEELEGIESSRWLENIFLGGIFRGMIDKFTASDGFTAMVNRTRSLNNSLKALAEPPEEFDGLYTKAKSLVGAEQSISDVFTGELDETAAQSIRELLADYETSLREAEQVGGEEGDPA